MNTEQLNRCVRGQRFLSPNLNTSCFANYSQRTDACLFSSGMRAMPMSNCGNQNGVDQPDVRLPVSTSTPLSLVWKLLHHRKASCEGKTEVASATAKMEEASRQMQLLAQRGQSSIVSEMEVREFLAKETGRDRLIKIFSKDNQGYYSQDLQFIKQVTMQTAAVTFIFMSMLSGRKAREDFIERNRVTVFKTRFQAFRRLHDVVFLHSMKEGAKWTLRISLFTLAFLGISQCIAVYRNKSSPWEYSISAATVIGLMKLNMGFKGFIAGTGIGAVMGFTMGLIAFGSMKAFNETQEQRHYWQIMKELEKEKVIQHMSKGLPAPVAGETTVMASGATMTQAA